MGRFRGGVTAILVGAGIAGAALTLPSGGCEFPSCFPDASNTGVPSGTSLTAYGGPTTITADDTTIDSKTMGCIGIATTAENITIRNSRISCNGGWAVQIDDSGTSGSRVTIEDSEILCTSGNSGSGVVGSQFTMTRVEISGCENGCSIDRDAHIEDSFIHNVVSEAIHEEAHSDGCQFAGGHLVGESVVLGVVNVTFLHNRIEGVSDEDDSLTTSAIISNPTGGGATDTNVLIENNLIVGGNTTIYCPRPGSGSNYRITDNKFDPNGGQGEDSCTGEADVSGNIDTDGNPYTLD